MDYIQIIGYVAMVITIASYQFKTQKTIVTLQFFSTFLFMIHFGLLHAYSGAILNGVCMVRAAIFSQRHKKWAAHQIWLWVFIFLSIATYFVASFVLIPMSPPQYLIDIIPSSSRDYLVIELVPVIGNVITTFATRMKEAKLVRRYVLFSSPLWLIYNVICGSVGGVVAEIVAASSIVIGMLRLDIKRK